MRILDLLDIFAKHQATNILILHIILPLFNAARKTGNEEDEASIKAIRVLRGIVTKPKGYPEIKDTSPILSILSAVHASARRSTSSDVSTLADSTSLYLARVILTSSEQRNINETCDIYAASLLDYLSRKASRVQPALLAHFIRRFKVAAWSVRDPLLEACSVRTMTSDRYKRLQCFTFLQELLVAHTSLVSGSFLKCFCVAYLAILDFRKPK